MHLEVMHLCWDFEGIFQKRIEWSHVLSQPLPTLHRWANFCHPQTFSQTFVDVGVKWRFKDLKVHMVYPCITVEPLNSIAFSSYSYEGEWAVCA